MRVMRLVRTAVVVSGAMAWPPMVSAQPVRVVPAAPRPGSATVQGFSVVPGLLDVVAEFGLSPRADHPRAVAACELVLEGLAAQKRISRSEELGYTRMKPERREPGYGKGGISFG